MKYLPKPKKHNETGTGSMYHTNEMSEWRDTGSKDVFVREFFESKIKNDNHLLDALEDSPKQS